MKTFITDEFLLETKEAQQLYHDYAEKLPIIDFHNHLPPAEIANDYQYKSLTEIWLKGDHYKWRAMRTLGIEEKYCTGNPTDYEKFEKWAETVPYTLRNPLYHWTHLELLRVFGVDEILNPSTADSIYNNCTSKLQTPEYSCRRLLERWNVETLCTTDDPADNLEYHKKIANDGWKVTVLPGWRPDRILNLSDLVSLNSYIDRLGASADTSISDLSSLKDAYQKRHSFFNSMGCKLSDYGLKTAHAATYTESEVETIFSKIRKSIKVNAEEEEKFITFMLTFFAELDHSTDWVQQYHIGAIRNNNTLMYNTLGPDTGFDSIGDAAYAEPLAKYIDNLLSKGRLTRTILYNLNPKDNEVMATMLGNFQGEGVRGRMQWGSAWWFLDQKDGMTKQIDTLSALGLLRLFVGMVTDSRSFMSYSRHEYFRRILCNMLGNDIKNGLITNDMPLLGAMVQDICYNNPKGYFKF
ncbi:glucuronate isomerase [uncultured Acetobacteroides sp.]|uniref:glucuronate isomerase n=1 Tax=uncultured Acetobacteroides sp. TaxID=1760811 RepID=UPI0029F49990|nr:glucuronate isomerase [uncultured Acetobacteroides sp.]